MFIDLICFSFEKVREWIGDYEQNWQNYKPPELNEEELNQFNKVYDEVADTASEWVEEFTEAEMNEREEEEKWFSQFLEPDAENWANEFTKNRKPSRPISNTGEPWVDEFHNNFNRDYNDDWVSEYQETVDPNSISDLTKKISQIPDPKLQQSSFMKFIKQVDSGEIQLDSLKSPLPE